MDKEQLTTWAGIPVADNQNVFTAWRSGSSRDFEKKIPITNWTN
jgi:hypothetical protein